VTSSPYVGYRVDFSLGAVPYRIVIDGSGAVLEHCATVCLPASNVVTNVGTTGTEVVVTVPLGLFGAAAGTPLTGITVSSTLLAPAAPAQDVDSLALPDTSLAGPTVRIGVAAPATDANTVQYATSVTPTNGAFTANFVAPSDGRAAVLWAKACVGDTCGDGMSYPLIATIPLVSINSISRGGNGRIMLEGTGAPNHTVTISASPDLMHTFDSIVSTTIDPAGVFRVEDADAANLPQRFYRVSYP
jgi:hypothetical protein